MKIGQHLKGFFGRIAESSALRMGRKIRKRKVGEKGGWEGGVNLSSESSSSFSCSKDGGRKRKKNGRKNGSVIGLFHGQINRTEEREDIRMVQGRKQKFPRKKIFSGIRVMSESASELKWASLSSIRDYYLHLLSSRPRFQLFPFL